LTFTVAPLERNGIETGALLLGVGGIFWVAGELVGSNTSVWSGAVAAGLGVVRLFGAVLRGRGLGSARGTSAPEVQASLRAMVALAALDRASAAGTEPDPGVVSRVARALFGVELEPEQLRALREELTHSTRAFFDTVEVYAQELSEPARDTALKAALLVAVARGAIREQEQHQVLHLAHLLRVPRHRLATCFVEALRAAPQLHGGHAVATAP
jgi:phytoene/squalene synthetase